MLVICFFLVAYTMEGQEKVTFGENPFAQVDSVKEVTKSAASHIRHHRRLHSGYSGYFVELKHCHEPLARSNATLQHFGIIHYDLLEDGTYSYGLKAQFDRKKTFKKYVREVIYPQKEDVHIFRYKYGKRKEMNFSP